MQLVSFGTRTSAEISYSDYNVSSYVNKLFFTVYIFQDETVKVMLNLKPRSQNVFGGLSSAVNGSFMSTNDRSHLLTSCFSDQLI